jgi:L-rhamnose mutarotase
MKRYCFVLELKEEFVKDFSELHKNPWPEVLQALKDNGCNEHLVWIYKNLAIVFNESENMDTVFNRLDKVEILQKWNVLESPWIKTGPSKDSEGKTICLEKIFDLNQQLKGELKQY